ncbi:MAG: DUF2508 family protein [Lachnospiraceae bacterium]|nr:DUF2508 family protein [Lachnospiraceae bacterium]
MAITMKHPSILNQPPLHKTADTFIQEKKNLSALKKESSNSYLLDDINDTKRDIETLLLHLDYQTDPDMIDCYSYQLKGAYMKYKFLLRQIQQTAN